MSQPSGQSGLTKHETRRSLESFNWSLSLRSVFVSVCAGTSFVFTAFALSLGLSKERMGFVTSVMSFACIIQTVSLIATTRVKDRKGFILSAAIAEPVLVIVAVVLVPYLPAALRLLALGAAVFMAAALLHLTQPLTDEWLASTIPAEIRGRYLGRRFQIMSLVLIVTTLALGPIAEWIGKTNTTGLSQLLAVGGLFGVLSVLALRWATMPAVSTTSRVEWHDIPRTFRSPGFKRYVLAVLIYSLPFFPTVPYYQVVNLEVLHMRESFIGYMMGGYYIVKIVAMPWVGRYVDRRGARHAMLVFGPAYVLFFAGYALSSAGRVWPAVMAWAVAGVADAAFPVAMTGALYAAVPEEPARPAYFAVNNLCSLATYGIGAVAAVPVLEALDGVHVSIGPIRLEQFQCFFAFCTLLMVPCMFGALLLAHPERQAAGPPHSRPDDAAI